MSKIKKVIAREILDSRGNPTVECDIFLEDNSFGRAAVPSGASTGKHEAIELRDGDKNRYFGKGVLKAVKNINQRLSPHILNKNFDTFKTFDNFLIDFDGTDNKSGLGANATLAVSLAFAKSLGQQSQQPFFSFLSQCNDFLLPMPMMNIINGGAHADSGLDIQEFMVMPIGALNFSEAVRWGAEIFHSLKARLKQSGHSTTVGDEGGFAPSFASNSQALLELMSSVEDAGFRPGVDVALSLDIAANELFLDGVYHLKGEDRQFSADQLIDYLESLSKDYPIWSIEDGLAEDDWEGWCRLTERLGSQIQLVGDDLFVTNQDRLRLGIQKGAANAILIKMNQVGTLTETLDAVEMAHRAGYRAVVSHRSGETEDTTIADLAVATNCGQIKAGSLSRTDRLAKYNQLIRIEEQLGKSACYGPWIGPCK